MTRQCNAKVGTAVYPSSRAVLLAKTGKSLFAFGLGSLLALVISAIGPTTSLAQEEQQPAEPASLSQRDRQMVEQSKQMEEMAKAMTSMAQMCETMMKMEMQNHPLKVAAVSVAGGLLSVALLLFIVLEVQWMRWWSLQIRKDK